jgi:aminoglycoside phosphotransferase (APT) family kinase protein
MNSQVVPADIEINESVMQKLLNEQFHLQAQGVVLLGEGFDNAVYLVDGIWVFRLPRRAEAIELVAMEMRVLPLLKNRLSLKIPEPVFLGQPSKTFPRPFYGHALIEGHSGCSVHLSPKEYEQAATDLGRFLKQLHEIDISELGLTAADMIPVFDRGDFNRLIKVFDNRLLEVVKHYDLKIYRDKMDNICEAARAYRNARGAQCFIHGDVYNRHLIFDKDNRLSGIIDWGDCAIGDPVADLGVVYGFFPKGCHQWFWAAYGVIDQETKDYARFIGLYYAVALLWFGHDRKDHDLIRTSLATFMEI